MAYLERCYNDEVGESELRNDEDVEGILKIAVSQMGISQGQSLRQRLMLSAEEMGLTPEQIQAAEEEWFTRAKEQRELAEFKTHQQRSFWGHFASYVIVNTFLVLMNLFTDGTVDWAVWPILGWGIGIAFSAWGTFFQSSDHFQEEFQAWRKKRDALPERADPDK